MIPTIELDEETFQRIFEKARKRIPVIFPEWTNFNENDSGIVMLELFSWLKEMQEYHMNQIGEKHLRTYLKLLGMEQHKKQPAKAIVRCYEIERAMVLPKGTQFYAGDVPFETMQRLHIPSGKVINKAVFHPQEGTLYIKEHKKRVNQNLSIFGKKPVIGCTFSIYFDEPLMAELDYGFYFDMKKTFPQERNPIIDKTFVPLVELAFEYEGADGFYPLTVIKEDTYGLLQSGIIRLRKEENGIPHKKGEHGYGIHIRLKDGEYDAAPVLCYLDQNPVELVQWEQMGERVLGEGTGLPSQEILLEDEAILGDTIRVSVEDPLHRGRYKEWTWVSGFEGSGPADEHFTVEEDSGIIRFGDGYHGLPPEGEIRLLGGRRTLKELGNVKKGQIQHESESWKAINEDNASGGCHAETLQECFQRFFYESNLNEYVVINEDYERAVRQTPGLIIQNVNAIEGEADNSLSLVVQPFSIEDYHPLSQAYQQNIINYMNERRLIGTHLKVLSPEYVSIHLYMDLVLFAHYRNALDEVKQKLKHFFEKEQAAIGETLLYSSVYGFVDSLDYVREVVSLTMEARGQRISRNQNGDVILPENGLAVLADIQCRVSFSE